MASIVQPSSPNKSKATSITSPTFTKSSSRVFVDVSVPRHQGRRLSLADIDPDASKALKMSSKLSVKLPKDGKAGDASSRALKPTTRTNSFTGVKRGREDEKDEKEGAKKRKVDMDGKIQVSQTWLEVTFDARSDADIELQKSNTNKKNESKLPGGTLAPKKKLDTTTVAPVRHNRHLHGHC
jgi:hypothetical protein